MAVSISLVITQNSQSIANNTSNVTVRVNAAWTGGSFNGTYPPPSGWLIVNGTRYDFSSTFNYPNPTNTGGCELFKVANVTIPHNSDGTKTLHCSASFNTGVSSGTVTTGDVTKTLTRIARKSSLSVKSGTLGSATTLTVSRQDDSLTHTIEWTCGSTGGTICTKSSKTSISWTPPISLAAQYPTRTDIPVVFSITTYSGSTKVGDPSTTTMGFTVPASVKPSCSITVTDPTGVADIYGSPVQGLSKFRVTVTATQSQGAAISSYRSDANGSTYTSASFTTGVLNSSGSLKVTSTVTDKRGRSGSNSVSKTVLAYSDPVIIKLSVKRCNADAVANDQGEYVQVTFSATVTSLNSKNTASYVLKYKRSSDADYTVIGLNDYAGSYAVTDGTYIFPADTGSSYNVEFDVIDRHNTSSRTTTVSTGFTLMNWNVAGNGMGIGKVSELQKVLDIGLQTRFYGGLMPVVLEPGSDINDQKTPNTYIGANVTSYEYENCPISDGTFTLIVEGAGEAGQVRQTFLTCSKYKPQRFVRYYYQSSWGPWMHGTTEEVVLYENASGSDGAISLEFDVQYFTYLEVYYTDNNGRGCSYTKVWNPSGKTLHLQLQEAGDNIYYRQTTYTVSGKTLSPTTSTASYVRITPAGAVSTSVGTNYIKIVRVIGLA